MADDESAETPTPDTSSGKPPAQRAGQLTRSEPGSNVRAQLDRVLTEGLLAHTDVAQALAKNLNSATLSLPSAAEIDQALGRLAPDPVATAADIENLLSLGDLSDMEVAGMRLNQLLENRPNEQRMLIRGLAFLKRKMYGEAAEWWLLNRPPNAAADPKLHLLLTLLVVITYRFAGDHARAQPYLIEAQRNPSYQHRP